MKRTMNPLLKVRKDLTYKECARAIRNVFDSLMEKHDWLMDDGHDGWGECPCQVALVLRKMYESLEDSAEWFTMKEKRNGKRI